MNRETAGELDERKRCMHELERCGSFSLPVQLSNPPVQRETSILIWWGFLASTSCMSFHGFTYIKRQRRDNHYLKVDHKWITLYSWIGLHYSVLGLVLYYPRKPNLVWLAHAQGKTHGFPLWFLVQPEIL